MKTWKKMILMFAISMVVGLYSTFVIQNLWNWFAVRALNAPEISYWTMYGLLMIVYLMLQREEFQDEQFRKRVGIMLFACIPGEKLAEVKEELKTEDDDTALNLGAAIFGKGLGYTVALGVGWFVHSFLVNN